MIKVNGKKVEINHFPDGTLRLKVDPECNNEIIWVYENEEEFAVLIYITKHLKSFVSFKSIVLDMCYLPNARMDRIKNNDEVFTLKYFTDVINWLGFDEVHVMDVHSDVSKALLDRSVFENPSEYISFVLGYISEGDLSNVVLYYPDASSAKRYSEFFANVSYCYGEKIRDWDTGKILGLEIKGNGIDLKDKTVLMVDDIISYGGSLYHSANALKEYDVNKIFAYVTHTENSILNREKGTLIKVLEDNTVEKLFTTNSLFTGHHEKIEVMEVYHE